MAEVQEGIRHQRMAREWALLMLILSQLRRNSTGFPRAAGAEANIVDAPGGSIGPGTAF